MVKDEKLNKEHAGGTLHFDQESLMRSHKRLCEPEIDFRLVMKDKRIMYTKDVSLSTSKSENMNL